LLKSEILNKTMKDGYHFVSTILTIETCSKFL